MKRPAFATTLLALCATLAAADPTPAPAPAKQPPHVPKEKPTYADVAYGSDPKQKLDIYLPTSGNGPFPLILQIHGGGWFAGDKITGAGEPAPYLDHGIAFVSIDYRLISDAVAEGINPPIPAVLGDNRRALQFMRLHAAEYKIDPNRILVTGGSAGAYSALYLDCEGEQADPNSSDPVERVSTKIVGCIPGAAQCSIDPQTIHEWVPGCAWGYWACEPPQPPNYGSIELFDKYWGDRDKWLPVIQKYSPQYLIAKDTPPIFFEYGQTPPDPSQPWPKSGDLVHSPLWGLGFQKIAQEKGVPCYIRWKGHEDPKYPRGGTWNFICERLGIPHQ